VIDRSQSNKKDIQLVARFLEDTGDSYKLNQGRGERKSET
jgi:hypothetical protein